jgi:hypothetical protein
MENNYIYIYIYILSFINSHQIIINTNRIGNLSNTIEFLDGV